MTLAEKILEGLHDSGLIHAYKDGTIDYRIINRDAIPIIESIIDEHDRERMERLERIADGIMTKADEQWAKERYDKKSTDPRPDIETIIKKMDDSYEGISPYNSPDELRAEYHNETAFNPMVYRSHYITWLEDKLTSKLKP